MRAGACRGRIWQPSASASSISSGRGGHVVHPAAVHAGHALGPQTDGGAGGVHAHVAAADDHHAFAAEVGGVALAAVAQELYGGQHVLAVLAFQAQLLVGVGADGDVQRVVFFLQFSQLDVLAHADAGMYLDAGGQDVVQIALQHVGRQAVVGDAVAQHTAQLLPAAQTP